MVLIADPLGHGGWSLPGPDAGQRLEIGQHRHTEGQKADRMPLVVGDKQDTSILPRHELKSVPKAQEAGHEPPHERSSTPRCKQWRPASTKGLSDKRSPPAELDRASIRPSLHQEQT